ncbi:MAG: 2-amino-4-hydroxy-6-hydroxymethyldihydropteridine pyrophosphokinase [Fimbriimonadales bacterium]
MARVFFSLGSNLGDTQSHLRYAIECLAREVGPIVRVSSLYRTAPQGVADQPDYLNAVVECETSLRPEEVLERSLSIEASRGRTRERSGSPRTLDIDVLLYDDLHIETDALCIPHPRMEQRSFVLTPLAEIEPDLVLPSGASVTALLGTPDIGAQRVERLAEPTASIHPTY